MTVVLLLVLIVVWLATMVSVALYPFLTMQVIPQGQFHVSKWERMEHSGDKLGKFTNNSHVISPVYRTHTSMLTV